MMFEAQLRVLVLSVGVGMSCWLTAFYLIHCLRNRARRGTDRRRVGAGAAFSTACADIHCRLTQRHAAASTLRWSLIACERALDRGWWGYRSVRRDERST